MKKSIRLVINYYNYFCTNVIISLLKTHNKLECSKDNNQKKLDVNKYQVLKDLYIKYKTNKYFEKEYELDKVSDNIEIKNEITNIISSNKVVKKDGNILFSKIVYPDSITFSGVRDSINNEINNWFNTATSNISYIEFSKNEMG